MRLLRNKIELAKDILGKINSRSQALESQPLFQMQKALLSREINSMRYENEKLASLSRAAQEKELQERFKDFSALTKTEQYCSSLQQMMSSFKHDSIEGRSRLFLKKFGKPSVRGTAKTKIAFDPVNRLGWTALLKAIIPGDAPAHASEIDEAHSQVRCPAAKRKESS